jgi:hypothetical protein
MSIQSSYVRRGLFAARSFLLLIAMGAANVPADAAAPHHFTDKDRLSR